MKAKKTLLAACLSLISLVGFAQVTTYTVTTTGETIKIDPTELASGASPNYTQAGRTVVSNQGNYFGWFLYPYMTETIEARWGLWQGDQLAQLGEVFEIAVNQDGNNGRRIPIFINAPAGTYKIKPLIRRLNQDYWTIPKDKSDYGLNDLGSRFSYKNWEYKIEDINTHKAPSVLLLCSEGLSDELVGGTGIPDLFNGAEERKCFERFDAFVRLSNNSNKTKKGKIKLMYERNFDKFWLGYAKTVPVMNQWSDCITKGATMSGFTDWDGTGLPVEIPANTADVRYDIKGCYASTYQAWGDMYTPYVHVYFQPEGSNDWLLCGLDASDEFTPQHVVIPSVYQKNCNSFALWISDAPDTSVAASQETTTYDWAAKTLAISDVPAHSYVFLYDLDGKTVKAEPTVSGGTYTFNTAALSGTFLLKIISGTAVKSLKLTL